jgi:PKD repeat protein
MTKKYLLTLFAFVFSLSAFAQTTVPSLITSDQVWTAAGSPYSVGQNTLIDSGVSVTVMPGTVINGTASGIKLMVDGEFRVLGNKDSLVQINRLAIELTKKSVDYNPTTNQGALFEYCNFFGLGTGQRGLEIKSTDVKIDYCSFDSMYYGVYAISSIDSVRIQVYNSTFRGLGNSGNYYSGYPLYISGTSAKCDIQNNNFSKAMYVYLYGDVIFKKNNCWKLRAANFTLYNDGDISCNHFFELEQGVNVTLNSSTAGKNFNFSYNTLDSVSYSSNYPMFKLSGSFVKNYTSLTVNHNNFNFLAGGTFKVMIQGQNLAPSRSDTLDFRSNYWGTTNDSTIASYIKDYNDDIFIFATADFSNPDSSYNTGCPDVKPKCGTADFSYMVKTDTVQFVDASTITGTYDLEWLFGDGSTETGSASPQHIYTKSGDYKVCLNLYDSNQVLCDTKCKTITVIVPSSCKASFYIGLDTANKFNLFIINNSTGVTSTTKYYWTFGDGSGSTAKNPTHKYQKFGLYGMCLTIIDSAANCYSTYCDSIGLDSLGNLLKAEGFTISVVDEKDLLSIIDPISSNSLQIYPNPSTGLFQLKFSKYMPVTTEIEVYASNGQMVYQGTPRVSAEGTLSLNLNSLEDGIYSLILKTESASFSKRLVLMRP